MMNNGFVNDDLFAEVSNMTNVDLPWNDDNGMVMPWDEPVSEVSDAQAETKSEIAETVETVEEIISSDEDTASFMRVPEDTAPVETVVTSENESSERTVEEVISETTAESETTESEATTEIVETEVSSESEAVNESVVEEETNADTEEKDADKVTESVNSFEEEKEQITSVVNSLISLPAGDTNYEGSLAKATVEELEKALEIMKKGGKHATRIKKCEKQLEKAKENRKKEEAEKAIKERFNVTDNVATILAEYNTAKYYIAINQATIEELEDALSKISKDDDDKIKSVTSYLNNKKIRDSGKETDKTNEVSDEDTAEDEEEAEPTPVFEEDEFTKLENTDISIKEKTLLYMCNQYHISPSLLNCLLNGDFNESWEEIKEINKTNLSVRNKLMKELGSVNDSRLKVVNYLCDKATKEPEFANKVLLEHKSIKKCINYYMNKVNEFVTKGSDFVQVDDDVVYAWAVEYYNLDDFAEFIEEKKKEEEAKLRKKEKKVAKKTTKKASVKTEAKKEEKTDAEADTSSDEKADKKVVPFDSSLQPQSDVSPEPVKDEDDKTDIVVPSITKDEEKLIKTVEKAEEKKNEEEFTIADSFGQLTFSF